MLNCAAQFVEVIWGTFFQADSYSQVHLLSKAENDYASMVRLMYSAPKMATKLSAIKFRYEVNPYSTDNFQTVIVMQVISFLLMQ